MSATIAQLQLSATSPRNTSVYAKFAFSVTNSIEAAISGALISKPMAQITGSDRGYRLPNLVDRKLPSGTPIIPAIIVITPNLNDTLN